MSMQNWPLSSKLLVVFQVSWLAFLGPMSAAVPNPAFVPLSEAFDITIVQASYELTMYIAWAGVGPLLVVPFANLYGRRPVYLLGNLIGAITNIAAGYSPTWAGILATRAFNGIAAGSYFDDRNPSPTLKRNCSHCLPYLMFDTLPWGWHCIHSSEIIADLFAFYV